MTPAVHILGIRHHGPGSSRSLLRALKDIKPDCVLVEGPPDADEIIAHAAKADMKPPVAILIHDVDQPSRAVYYPFAEFSPEWQAIRWALSKGVPVRFMDLPQWHRIAVDAERAKALLAALQQRLQEAEREDDEGEGNEAPMESPALDLGAVPEPDPLGQLARAAGFDDGERWWEHVVEHRGDGGVGMFEAVREAMAELRQAQTQPRDEDEPLREAWMRRTIREAVGEGFGKIAVVCGAWHGPALDLDDVPKKEDDERLKGLPKVKTAATWVPWTYRHLTFASGYGAGVHSPGWYEHLWKQPGDVIASWMTRVARLLRDKDLDCSSAHVIEAVRLSHTLAAFRGRPLADLSDIADATRSVFCFDGDLAMNLIARELLVGDRLGEVPEDTPLVPLHQDLLRQQKRLRLKPEALEKTLDLDLRNENDRERSKLLHRLGLLNVDWGIVQEDAGGGKGTFHEIWLLRWDPGFVIRLIEAGALGNTIELAASAKLRQVARDSSDLRTLAGLLQNALLSELGEAVAELVRQIENAAAIAADVTLLMQTLPRLAGVLRYGNVRQTDTGLVRHIIDGIVPRITVGLGGAVGSLNDEAAEQMQTDLRGTHGAVELLESEAHSAAWFGALQRIIAQDSVHGLVRGYAARLLLDAGRIDNEAAGRRLSLALLRGTDPATAGRWVEGFLSGSGLLLIHDAALLGILDQWVADIPDEVFQDLLPLLRRAFSAFPAPERRQIGQMLTKGTSAAKGTATTDEGLDPERGAQALPLLLQILGGGNGKH